MAEKCPICANGLLVNRNDAFEVKFVDRKGVENVLILPSLQRERCDSCGEEILDDAATNAVEKARLEAIGLMTPADIRELRSRFGKTQLQMSDLLGVGAKTYCRWESGASTQTVAFDNYLRVIRDVPEACQLLARLEQYGVAESSAKGEENEEFTFLKDVGDLLGPAAEFTNQLLAGTLHT
jgi:putative zinc finger/helix-turn-helix YgiT family protein